MLWILVGIILTVAGYFLLIHPLTYWKKKGVKHGSLLKFFDYNWTVLTRKRTLGEFVQAYYNAYPNTRYSPMYSLNLPSLVLRDPELIKQITVKDFDHFVDHSTFIAEDVDPLWGKNLFALTGQRWRDMRSTLSPTFTSSKMRHMFVLISDSAEQFVQYFLRQKEEVITVEIKDALTRFTNDVIANVVFGIQCDSLEKRDNEFYLMGKDVTTFKGFWKISKIILNVVCPKLSKITGARLFSKEVGDFFQKIVKENIASREKNNIIRPDVINQLMEVRNGSVKHEETESSVKESGFATAEESDVGRTQKTHKTPVTDEDITAQALVFFFAGFESVSSFMLFTAYELAINPDIQEKLIKEVDEVSKSSGKKLTYEAILKMKYLDMVISESLRKWPVTAGVDRICTKPYVIEPKLPDEVPIYLKEKDIVLLPIYGLHRDPQYYPDPEKFDPERFNDENKINIKPYTYIPFGSGPRNCIGSRFALLEAKALIFHILSHFEIVPVDKTDIPIKINKSLAFTLTPEKGLWLGLKRRPNRV